MKYAYFLRNHSIFDNMLHFSNVLSEYYARVTPVEQYDEPVGFVLTDLTRKSPFVGISSSYLAWPITSKTV